MLARIVSQGAPARAVYHVCLRVVDTLENVRRSVEPISIAVRPMNRTVRASTGAGAASFQLQECCAASSVGCSWTGSRWTARHARKLKEGRCFGAAATGESRPFDSSVPCR
jgi:hypothetical protein